MTVDLENRKEVDLILKDMVVWFQSRGIGGDKGIFLAAMLAGSCCGIIAPDRADFEALLAAVTNAMKHEAEFCFERREQKEPT